MRPVYHREHNDALAVDHLRVVGYRASAEDGWRGPVRARFANARLDAREHNQPAAS